MHVLDGVEDLADEVSSLGLGVGLVAVDQLIKKLTTSHTEGFG